MDQEGVQKRGGGEEASRVRTHLHRFSGSAGQQDRKRRILKRLQSPECAVCGGLPQHQDRPCNIKPMDKVLVNDGMNLSTDIHWNLLQHFIQFHDIVRNMPHSNILLPNHFAHFSPRHSPFALFHKLKELGIAVPA